MMLFSQVIGQERAKAFFRRVISEARIPHAYLFAGIAGIGKTSTATALAMVLNCQQPLDLESCGTCRSCRQMLGGNFPDLLSIKPDGQNIKIEQIRELNQRLGFAPLFGGYRVCVVQQAETMTHEAANAFLKTLEEPPPGNILVLIAVEPLNLLPTIVSRCQRVPFRPLPVDAITDWLVREKGLSKQAATIAGRSCGGSLGHAIRLSETAFLTCRETWTSAILKLPQATKGDAVQMADELALQDRARKRGGGDSSEPGLLEMLGMWAGWYRDLLLVKVDGPKDLIMNVDFLDRLKSIAQNATIEDVMDSILVVDRAIRDLLRMGNPSLVMEHAILSLQRLHSG